MNQTLKLLIVVLLAVLVAFPILAYKGVNSPLPFHDWGVGIYSALTSLSLNKLSTAVYALIGGTGAATGAAGGLAYVYKKTKETLKQTQTALVNTQNTLTSTTQSLTQEKASLELQAKSIADKLAAEKQAALNEATQLKTQVSTMQQNYNSLDSQKTALFNQVNDMKAQAAKAQAQLDVLIPRVK